MSAEIAPFVPRTNRKRVPTAHNGVGLMPVHKNILKLSTAANREVSRVTVISRELCYDR